MKFDVFGKFKSSKIDEYDEDGRLITSSKEVQTEEYDEDGRLMSSSQEGQTEEYDEDGRLMTSSQEAQIEEYNEYERLINSSQETQTDKYNEDGRIITLPIKDEEEINDEFRVADKYKESNEEYIKDIDEYKNTILHEENQANNIEIEFALINPQERFVQKISNWDINEGDSGLFFIYNVDKSILDMNLELKNSDEEVVWFSEIRELPKDKLVLINCQANNIYISNKVLRAEDMPKGDETYFINIRGMENVDKAVILETYDMRNINENKEIVSFNIEDFVVENEAEVSKEIYEIEYKDIDNVENELFDPESNHISDSVLQPLDSAISHQFYKESPRVVEKLVEVEKVVYPSDIKSIIIQSVINHVPVNIDCRKNKEAIKEQNSIVIEKIGNYYTVIQYGFMNKAIYILNGEEQYFNFSGMPIEFIAKIESIVCRMYGIDKNGFNELNKLLILDENSQDINEFEDVENIKVLSREVILNNIVSTNEKVIIDLGYRSCNFVFNDEDDNTVNIVCEGLGLNKGDYVLETIKDLSDKLDQEKLLFTGLFFVDTNLYNKVSAIDDKKTDIRSMLSKHIGL